MHPDKPQATELEAALEAQVATIFECCTELHAFSIAERLVYENAEEGVREWELYVAAIAAYPELASSESELVAGRISGVACGDLQRVPAGGRASARAHLRSRLALKSG